MRRWEVSGTDFILADGIPHPLFSRYPFSHSTGMVIDVADSMTVEVTNSIQMEGASLPVNAQMKGEDNPLEVLTSPVSLAVLGSLKLHAKKLSLLSARINAGIYEEDVQEKLLSDDAEIRIVRISKFIAESKEFLQARENPETSEAYLAASHQFKVLDDDANEAKSHLGQNDIDALDSYIAAMLP